MSGISRGKVKEQKIIGERVEGVSKKYVKDKTFHAWSYGRFIKR